MRLTQRLILGSLVVIGLLVAVVVNLIDNRLSRRISEQTEDELWRESRLVALQWTPQSNADSLANAAGLALGHRVTLIDSTGRVIGDSEFDGPSLARLQNHSTRPEVMEAVRSGRGTARRVSSSAGDEEMYVAVRIGSRIARVSVGIRAVNQLLSRARRDVLIAGAIALGVALVLAAFFARAVSGPIVELRDVATRLASGDLSSRPRLRAPGEVGDLARAVHSLGEQLGARLLALQSEEALSRAVFDALEEGVMAVDPSRMVLRINDSCRRILGVKEPVPFPVDNLPDDAPLHEAIHVALRGDPHEQEEVTVSRRTVAITALPLGDGGAIVALYDVTRMRRLERVRRDFVANVSHELKTPLTVIRGFAETLVDEHLPFEQRKQFAEAIRGNSSRMQHLVDDLLDLSRIESGGWVPDPERMRVEQLLGEVAASVRGTAAPKGLTVDVNVTDDTSDVTADPMAMRQVVTNLAENAIRYTQAGTVTLFGRREHGGTWIGVRDTGVGIPPEHLPRIFERFYRVDPARSRQFGGTGLGLSIVKHLAEAHGGRVRAESLPGHGTLVEAFFPDAVALTR